MTASSRMHEIEDLAEFVAESFFPNDRIEPAPIADNNGVSHNFGHYEDAFDGLLEYLDGAFHIYGNLDRVKSPDHARARFTFCHELGHYYIDDHRNALASGVDPHGSFTDFQSNNPIEREADAFAAALLMPARRFESAARRLDPGVQAICELVDLFGTSYSSTAIRYAKSNTHSVLAMRWTTAERKWCWSSEDMQQITQNKPYKARDRLPQGSLTALALGGGDVSEKAFGSTLSAWCPFVRSGSPSDWIVAEEVLPLGEFGVLTLLYPA